jgi:hypothetical protein
MQPSVVGCAINAPPLFNWHELKETSVAYAGRKACDVLLSNLVYLAERILIVHRREERLGLLVGDPPRLVIGEHLDRCGQQRLAPLASAMLRLKRLDLSRQENLTFENDTSAFPSDWMRSPSG